ncbi:MAG: hypothetical protein ACI90V_006559, partial [Bacillariaceae sp.]|jgi:hypothetical protein
VRSNAAVAHLVATKSKKKDRKEKPLLVVAETKKEKNMYDALAIFMLFFAMGSVVFLEFAHFRTPANVNVSPRMNIIWIFNSRSIIIKWPAKRIISNTLHHFVCAACMQRGIIRTKLLLRIELDFFFYLYKLNVISCNWFFKIKYCLYSRPCVSWL